MRMPGIILGIFVALIFASSLAFGDGVICQTDPVLSTIDTPETPRTIAFLGTTAYIGTGANGLLMYDIADPEQPMYIGTFATTRPIDFASVHNGYLFIIGNGSAGVDILELSDPYAPVAVGFASVPGPSKTLAFEGTTMYAAGRYTREIHAIDISNPTSPTSLGVVASNVPGSFNFPRKIAASGSHVYLLSEDSGLVVFDVSDPAEMTQVGSYLILALSNDIEIRGDLALIATSASSDGTVLTTTLVLDISDPTNPTLIEQTAPVEYLSFASSAAFHDSKVFLSYIDELVAFDFSDPASPTLWMGIADLPRAAGQRIAIDVYGDVVFVNTANGFMLLDPRTSNAPIGLSRLPYHNQIVNRASRFAVDGGLLCMPDEDLYVYDVSDSQFPDLRSIFDLPGTGHDVAIKDTAAYVATPEDGVCVIDLTDPDTPILIRQFRLNDNTRGLAIQDNNLYTVDPTNGLMIYRITHPDSHWFRGSVALGSDEPAQVVVDGTLAYVSMGNDGFQIVDVSDPTAPALLGFIDLQGSTQAFCVRGTTAYVLSYGNLWILDVSDPNIPTLVGSLDAVEYLLSITLVGDYAYVTGANQMFSVIDIADPQNPVIVDDFTYMTHQFLQLISDETIGYLYTRYDPAGYFTQYSVLTLDLGSECPAPCTADLTGDGVLDIFDIFAYLDLFNTSDPGADITGDGVLDIFDVFVFLDLFNAGCP